MTRFVSCHISTDDWYTPHCTLGWVKQEVGRSERFTPLDPLEVYDNYGDSLKALADAIVRLEGLPIALSKELAENRLRWALFQDIGTSSEQGRYRQRFGWQGRW